MSVGAARCRACLPLAGFLAFLWWLLLAAAVYLAGHTGAYDLGYYLEALRRMAAGSWNPTPPALPGHSYLADNIALWSYPVALLFRLWPSPWLLFGLQAAWFAGIVVLALRHALRRGLGRPARLLLTLLFVLYPPAAAIAVQSFHFDPLAALFAFALFWALEEGRIRAAWLLALATLLVKEDAGLALASAALLHLGLGAPAGTRRHAAAMALVGLASVLIAGFLLMPLLSPHHAAYMRATLFGTGAHGLSGILTASAASLLWPQKPLYLLHLLLPLLFLPLLRPRLWPAILAALAVNLAALNPAFYSGFFQYSAYALPALFVATTEGLITILRLAATLRPLTRRLLAATGALLWLSGQVLYGSPPIGATALLIRSLEGSPRLSFLAHLRAHIGTGSLLTTNSLLPYLDRSGKSRLVPVFAPADVLAAFVSELGPRFIALDREEQDLPMHDYLTLVPVAEAAGYRLLREQDGIALLGRRGRYRPLAATYGRSTRLALVWGPGNGLRKLLGGLALPALGARTALRRGFWDLDLSVFGHGVVVACAAAGRESTCSWEVPVVGGATVPLQIFVPRAEPVRLFLGQFAGPGLGQAVAVRPGAATAVPVGVRVRRHAHAVRSP